VDFTKEITRLEKSNIKVTFTVPKEDAYAKYQEMLRGITKDLQLPGFRKGKVPQAVLEQKYSETLKIDAIGRIIDTVIKDAFKDENMDRYERPLPYSPPELQGEPKLDFEQDFQFSIVYDVLPKVEIKQWKGITIEVPYAQVEEADIIRELEIIQDRNALVLDRNEDAVATNGDVVTINYNIIDETDEALENYEREGFVYTLGSGHNMYQFDDEIIGIKKGETKEFEKKFPDDFSDSLLAGQTRKIKVTLTELKGKILPDLDDELAQDVNEKFNTLDDLKNNIKDYLNANLEKRHRELKINSLLKIIMEDNPVVLPESMIRLEMDNRWKKIARYYNTSVEKIKQMLIPGASHLEKEMGLHKDVDATLHSRVIMETIIEEQNINITDDDLEKEFERIAAEGNRDIEEIRNDFEDERRLFFLKEDMKERIAYDILIVENIIKQGKKENYLDFMSIHN
jgi:trigger factor